MSSTPLARHAGNGVSAVHCSRRLERGILCVPRGRLAQLVRARASHARGHRFESYSAHHSFNEQAVPFLNVERSSFNVPNAVRYFRGVTISDRRRAPRSERPRALVVDDHADSRDVYETALNIVGFEIASAANAASAFVSATRGGADIIVVDPGLPGIDGWQLIELLRGDERTAAIPIVVVSGHALPEVEARAFTLGCAAFFAKPCPPFELADALRSVIYRPPVAPV